jgi:REP element-mobilizing transposase RayT
MSEHIFKRHSKTLLMYHLVCPAKYRSKIFTPQVEKDLKTICLNFQEAYEIFFVEIGADTDHVHFLIQSIPNLSPAKIVNILKSITAKELFKLHPNLRILTRGNSIWTSGYYMNTVSQSGNEKVIKEYVAKQGKKYDQIYRTQPSLFDELI